MNQKLSIEVSIPEEYVLIKKVDLDELKQKAKDNEKEKSDPVTQINITEGGTTQKYAFHKGIAEIFGYKSPGRMLKDFRDFVDGNPNYFKPIKRPYVKNKGLHTMYSIYAFAFYFENKDLVDAGSRSISFKKELENLKEVY